MRLMTIGLSVLIVALLGLMAYVRLSPIDTASVNTAPHLYGWDHGGPWDQVVPLTGGASLRLSTAKGAPQELLAKLDAIAVATPRTTRLAGSVDQGMITWQTRSALWGFPDYTTAELRDDGLYIYARLRFGREDMGVNATRLTDWLSRL